MEPEINILTGQYRSVQERDGKKLYRFVASNEQVDRHGTVIKAKGWSIDNFRSNPIIGYQHNVYGDMCNAPNPDDVIGRAVDTWVENNELMVDIEFDNESDIGRKVESKIARGFLNAVSVGFRPLSKQRSGAEEHGEDPNVRYFDKAELLEVSIVNIPSNPGARKKQLRSNTFDALKYIYRELGGRYRMSEIEDMKVSDILKMLAGDEEEKKEEKKLHIEQRFSVKTIGKSKTDLVETRSQNQ